jgi:CheY-like chemotaxis protein
MGNLTFFMLLYHVRSALVLHSITIGDTNTLCCSHRSQDVQQAMMSLQQHRTHHPQPKASPSTRKNILIIDDSQVIGILLESQLTSQGHQAIIATNFHDGMRQIAQKTVDLIILDLNLPDGNGLDLLHMHKDGTNHSTPTMMISGMQQADVIERAFALGAVDYVCKPFNLDDLMTRIYLHLGIQPTEA